MQTRKHISLLVVEDDVTHFEVVENDLKRRPINFKTTHVINCAEARRELIARAYDCVLLDHHLPDGNAVDVLQFIRQNGVNMPVIVFTTSDEEDVRIENMNAGCSHFLCKHEAFKRNHLYNLIVNEVESARSTAQTQSNEALSNERRVIRPKARPAPSQSVRLASNTEQQSPPFDINQHGNITVVRIHNEELYDPAIIETIRLHLSAMIKSSDRPALAIDMVNVRRLGARFTGVLESLQRDVTEKGGSLVLTNVDESTNLPQTQNAAPLVSPRRFSTPGAEPEAGKPKAVPTTRQMEQPSDSKAFSNALRWVDSSAKMDSELTETSQFTVHGVTTSIDPLNIVTVAPVYCHPQWFSSKLARLTNESMMAMADRGHRNVVFSPFMDRNKKFTFEDAFRNSGGKTHRKTNSIRFYDDLLRVYYCPDARTSKRGLESKALPEKLAPHLEEADLLCIAGPITPWALSAAQVAQDAGVPYVFESHGYVSPESLMQQQFRDRYVKRFVEPFLVNADAVIVQDEESAQTITDWNRRIPLHVCPVGLMSLRFNQRNQKRLVNDPYILSLGRLDDDHIKLLLGAFDQIAARNPYWKLVLAGPGIGENRSLVKQINAHRLNGRVVVAGCVSERKRASLLNYASLVFRPLSEHRMSLAVIEAMACRVPVLVTPGYQSAQIVDASAGRLIRSGADAFASTIYELIGDEDMREMMGGKGRNLFKKNYRFAPRIDRLLGIMDGVKSRGGADSASSDPEGQSRCAG